MAELVVYPPIINMFILDIFSSSFYKKKDWNQAVNKWCALNVIRQACYSQDGSEDFRIIDQGHGITRPTLLHSGVLGRQMSVGQMCKTSSCRAGFFGLFFFGRMLFVTHM
ncbi:hypothetical protein BX666DRAFT_1323447 [Dichotomocladium elegans]|nr:hypothetical protein BX666DRAFT_1323447 [Dichotomocladium elegans]